MPVTGPSSYLPTIDAFLAHWTLVNAALGGAGLVLSGSYPILSLTSDRIGLSMKIGAVDSALSTRLGASATRDLLKASVKERMRQFNSTVRGLLPNTKYVNMLPELPHFSDGFGGWQKAIDLMKNAWTTLNADMTVGIAVPLLLTGAYTAAMFTTDSTALLAALTAVTTATENYHAAIQTRDDAFALIRARLIQYRPAVEGAFTAGNALADSIPALTPASGSTPDPVAITGVWDAASSSAHLTWAATTDARVTGYEVRACFNESYRTSDESVLGPVALGTNHFESTEGLGASGAYVTYKVYTLTATGNEKGSNAVRVTRP